MDELLSKFRANKHPLVLRGHRTEKQILKKFLTSFETLAGHRNGIVTLNEFQAHYANVCTYFPCCLGEFNMCFTLQVSGNFDTDLQFESLMQDLWGPF